jgi:S-adenosylmethionine:tRNA ribosyltransferase-isomerase
MLRRDFYFDLPPELVAQYPPETRGGDRLLHLRGDGSVAHCVMRDLPSFIPPDALMVFNNSRVRRARVFAINEATGREAEFLFIAPLSPASWKVVAKRGKKQKAGMRYRFGGGVSGAVADNAAFDGTEFRELLLSPAIDECWFEAHGHVPLPPYIRRGDTALDGERYQSVYAAETGSVACPTAGLHFTGELLARIAEAGIEMAEVTLHVGPGTFLPVRSERVEDHEMHEESYTVGAAAAARVNAAKRAGRPVVAVGTTSARTLEAAWSAEAGLRAGSGATRIFIYPGYRFRATDLLFTNFHTPESTLLMLACAFAGKERIMRAYGEAIAHEYRFFSYGDAMLIDAPSPA